METDDKSQQTTTNKLDNRKNLLSTTESNHKYKSVRLRDDTYQRVTEYAKSYGVTISTAISSLFVRYDEKVANLTKDNEFMKKRMEYLEKENEDLRLENANFRGQLMRLVPMSERKDLQDKQNALQYDKDEDERQLQKFQQATAQRVEQEKNESSVITLQTIKDTMVKALDKQIRWMGNDNLDRWRGGDKVHEVLDIIDKDPERMQREDELFIALAKQKMPKQECEEGLRDARNAVLERIYDFMSENDRQFNPESYLAPEFYQPFSSVANGYQIGVVYPEGSAMDVAERWIRYLLENPTVMQTGISNNPPYTFTEDMRLKQPTAQSQSTNQPTSSLSPASPTSPQQNQPDNNSAYGSSLAKPIPW